MGSLIRGTHQEKIFSACIFFYEIHYAEAINIYDRLKMGNFAIFNVWI